METPPIKASASAVFAVSEELNAERQWRHFPVLVNVHTPSTVSEELNAERQWRPRTAAASL